MRMVGMNKTLQFWQHAFEFNAYKELHYIIDSKTIYVHVQLDPDYETDIHVI
jgi:hypothetical protein